MPPDPPRNLLLFPRSPSLPPLLKSWIDLPPQFIKIISTVLPLLLCLNVSHSHIHWLLNYRHFAHSAKRALSGQKNWLYSRTKSNSSTTCISHSILELKVNMLYKQNSNSIWFCNFFYQFQNFIWGAPGDAQSSDEGAHPPSRPLPRSYAIRGGFVLDISQ